jgi:hypothetical protein
MSSNAGMDADYSLLQTEKKGLENGKADECLEQSEQRRNRREVFGSVIHPKLSMMSIVTW